MDFLSCMLLLKLLEKKDVLPWESKSSVAVVCIVINAVLFSRLELF